MEFYIVAIIFIVCMIMLALLIYYCQEYRNKAKYSITGNQRDISGIALAIDAPTFSQKQYESNDPSSGIVPLLSSSQPSQSQPSSTHFMVSATQPEKTSLLLYPTKLPSLQDYARPSLIVEEDYSDSGSSSSSKIYFAPNTAAYSITKRMSISTNADAMVRKQSVQSALLLAKRLQELQQLQERIILERERNNYHAKNRRNTFHCITELPLLKRRDKRSKSPCTPLKSNSVSSLEEASACVQIDERKCPGRDKCESSNELAPPERSENISYPKPNNVAVKKEKNNKDRMFYVSTETTQNNSLPVSLSTVEEEE